MAAIERPFILILETDFELQRLFRGIFSRYQVGFAEDASHLLSVLKRQTAAVVMLDLGPVGNTAATVAAFSAIEQISSSAPQTKIIVLTEANDRMRAAKAIGLGAHDFFEKPLLEADLRMIVERAVRVYELERENNQASLVRPAAVLGDIVTRDPVMLKLCRQLERLAPVATLVSLHGESGTGKELFARTVHQLSQRKEDTFLVAHCAGLSKELPAAGTLFLDEVADLSVHLQLQLLDVADSRHIVLSTSKNLHTSVRAGLLREDLYYKLVEMTLTLPPLSERAGDATLLAHSFLKRMSMQYNRERMRLSEEALNAIEQHQWPGNVRELENRMKRALIMAEGRAIIAADLGLAAPETVHSLNLRRIRDEAEKQAVLKVMARVDDNIARAAQLLGVSRPTLYDLLNRFGLR